MASFRLGEPPEKHFEEACSRTHEALGCLSWPWLEEHAGSTGRMLLGAGRKCQENLRGSESLAGLSGEHRLTVPQDLPALPSVKGRSSAGYELSGKAWDGAAGSLMGAAVSRSRGDIICQKLIFLGNRDFPLMMTGRSHASPLPRGRGGFPEFPCFHLVLASCDC